MEEAVILAGADGIRYNENNSQLLVEAPRDPAIKSVFAPAS
jgi:hypothetical protein